MKLCVTEPDFMAKFSFPKNGGNGTKWTKNKVFRIYRKVWSLYLFQFGLQQVILFAIFLHKYHTWEEPDRRIFKSATYLGQSQKIVWFFAFLVQIQEIRRLSKIIWVRILNREYWSFRSWDSKTRCTSSISRVYKLS